MALLIDMLIPLLLCRDQRALEAEPEYVCGNDGLAIGAFVCLGEDAGFLEDFLQDSSVLFECRSAGGFEQKLDVFATILYVCKPGKCLVSMERRSIVSACILI